MRTMGVRSPFLPNRPRGERLDPARTSAPLHFKGTGRRARPPRCLRSAPSKKRGSRGSDCYWTGVGVARTTYEALWDAARGFALRVLEELQRKHSELSKNHAFVRSGC